MVALHGGDTWTWFDLKKRNAIIGSRRLEQDFPLARSGIWSYPLGFSLLAAARLELARHQAADPARFLKQVIAPPETPTVAIAVAP